MDAKHCYKYSLLFPPSHRPSLPSQLAPGKETGSSSEKCCRWMVCHGHSWTNLAPRCWSSACQLPSSPQIFVAEGLKGRGASLLTWSSLAGGVSGWQQTFLTRILRAGLLCQGGDGESKGWTWWLLPCKPGECWQPHRHC